MTDKKQKLTAEHFYKFFQCPHWIWYDIYEDQKKKKTMPPLMQMIYESGLKHEKEIIKSRKFEEVEPAMFKDLDEAFLATAELMKKGKNIYHGVLMDEHWVGIPDLLEAHPISELGDKKVKSKFGDYYYVVYDIKNSKDIKDEHKFQLVFYSLMLERIQGVRPREAYIINSQGEEKSFLIEEFLDYFNLTLANIEKILDGQKPPPFLKSGCKRTPWYSLCLSEVESCRDVSLIYRLSQADQRQLYEIGIKTIDDFAAADLEVLRSQLVTWNFDKLVRFHNQAYSLVKDEALILKKPSFPEVKTEIYFDIESDPTQDVDYMMGLLIKRPAAEIEQAFGKQGQVPKGRTLNASRFNIGTGKEGTRYNSNQFNPNIANLKLTQPFQSDNQKTVTGRDNLQQKNNIGIGTFKYFLANDKSEEEKMWREFTKFVEGLEDFVIYHYAFYERQTFDRLALKYGVSEEVLNKFKNNTIDLHRAAVDSVILPLYFYSLKDVARYIGFNWRAEDAGGAESVVWFNQWQESGDKKILQKILDYNKDDVVATMIVKEWLEKQKPKTRRELLPNE